MAVIRRYSLNGITSADLQRHVAQGALLGAPTQSPGVLVDVPLDELVVGYDSTTDEYMAMLGYSFVEEDPATGLLEASFAVVPLVSEIKLVANDAVNGAVVLDFTVSTVQRWTLTGSLGVNDISFVLPPSPRKLTLRIVQGGAGNFSIPDTAWPASVEWGSKSAVDVSAMAAGEGCFVVFDFPADGSVYAHYDDNVF